ncbi:CoB--CoM heterodisulfide reductase iron-sulfur subunit A family protein [Sulfolobus acidocaldarius]|uniref:Pyridine nucleotide-disulfide oxidoreductase n=3 Tax=Sulfolobus acidocaldarius TaxID=2285 RepID=A0A0U3GTK9_9CREN|nr:CoB--CoM heterodisulfide reductase iron-sulfur subunit A family protein [Sulfolobus acidocaldarius]AGE70303.1 heterodisulfide reductase A [Sulfolobus acidocaldarius N8]AGE72578.1 heterodisulfide reductase A [Sulfolobus acidocaldarius Ron12/I]ALU29296.1 pyridine nucleotide-disulfide oxidoreductase [Sulfolobus acidocaldarius]ALU32025.1 pyridine nucleotide-disulfide oxidoreductase [Sulfolobus acidocaldarius]WCM34315.1 FAD-binding protein [Sulfolobus acidocaldarius DSM 639]
MVNKSVLVVGAGPAGLSAAKELSRMGVDLILVERESYLGGTPKKLKYSLLFPELRPASEVLDPLVKSVEENGNVRVLTESIIENMKNVSDGFEVGIKDKKGNLKTEKVNAIIAASGFEHFDSRRKYEYGYGLIPNIYQISDIEGMLHENKLVTTKGTPPKRVAILLCVGSRDATVGNTYCSRVCCAISIKQAMEIKQRIPDAIVHIYYMDIRTYGLMEDKLYWKAQLDYRVGFIRGRISEFMRGPNDTVIIKGEDTMNLNRALVVPYDMVILANGMELGLGSKQVAKVLGLELEEHGFVKPLDPDRLPVQSTRKGVFLAGAITGPKGISDSITEGYAAALKAYQYVTSGVWEESNFGKMQQVIHH